MDQVPEDIGRTIFEMAAENGIGPVCALVSKKVQIWVTPVIYSRVVLLNENKTRLFCRTLQEAMHNKTSLRFIALYVKILIVVSIVPAPIGAIVAVLKSLRNLQTLMLWDWHVTLYEAITSSLLAPTRLSLGRTRLLPAQRHFSHPIFANLTHLEIVWRYPDCWERWNWDSLSQLTRLTHLSLNLVTNFVYKVAPSRVVELVEDLLAKCPPSVRVLVLWVPAHSFVDPLYSDGRTFQRAVDVDERVVLGCLGMDHEIDPRAFPNCAVLERSYEETMNDWTGLSNRKDFWTVAEEAVEKRRRRVVIKITTEVLGEQ